jgi:hypothetical protein
MDHKRTRHTTSSQRLQLEGVQHTAYEDSEMVLRSLVMSSTNEAKRERFSIDIGYDHEARVGEAARGDAQ